MNAASVIPMPVPSEQMIAYRDLLDASIADYEIAFEAERQAEREARKAADARQRIANRAPEIERLRVVTAERQAA